MSKDYHIDAVYTTVLPQPELPIRRAFGSAGETIGECVFGGVTHLTFKSLARPRRTRAANRRAGGGDADLRVR
jgi:hypothetical protein